MGVSLKGKIQSVKAGQAVPTSDGLMGMFSRDG
jgi:cell shape-determining protein MreC